MISDSSLNLLKIRDTVSRETPTKFAKFACVSIGEITYPSGSSGSGFAILSNSVHARCSAPSNVISVRRSSKRRMFEDILRNSAKDISELSDSNFRKSEFEAVLKVNPEEVQKKMDKALGRVKILETNE